MLLKILFTAAVVVGVIVFFRHRRAPAVAAAAGDESGARSIPPRALAYGLLGAVVTVAVLMYAFEQQRGSEVVTIRVTSASGESAAEYRARRRAISGRNFTTVDGVRVTPAVGERIEMLAR